MSERFPPKLKWVLALAVATATFTLVYILAFLCEALDQPGPAKTVADWLTKRGWIPFLQVMFGGYLLGCFAFSLILSDRRRSNRLRLTALLTVPIFLGALGYAIGVHAAGRGARMLLEGKPEGLEAAIVCMDLHVRALRDLMRLGILITGVNLPLTVALWLSRPAGPPRLPQPPVKEAGAAGPERVVLTSARPHTRLRTQ